MTLKLMDGGEADARLQKLAHESISILNDLDVCKSLYLRAGEFIPVNFGDDKGMATIATRDDREPGPFSFRRSRIYIGKDFLNPGGAGFQLMENGACEKEATLCCLAHELFHIDESFRLSACGVTYKESRSRFSWAIRPSFPPELNDFLRRAALASNNFDRLHPIVRPLMPPDMARAEDVCSEMCADLLAFHWMLEAKLDVPTIQQAVIQLRVSDENKITQNWPAPPNLSEYQIAGELPTLLNLPNRDAIILASTRRCLAIIANAPGLDSILKQDAQSLLNNGISLRHKEADIPKYMSDYEENNSSAKPKSFVEASRESFRTATKKIGALFIKGKP